MMSLVAISPLSFFKNLILRPSTTCSIFACFAKGKIASIGLPTICSRADFLTAKSDSAAISCAMTRS